MATDEKKLQTYEDGMQDTTFENKGQSQDAIIVTQPQEAYAQEVTPNDVKEIAKETDTQKQDSEIVAIVNKGINNGDIPSLDLTDVQTALNNGDLNVVANLVGKDVVAKTIKQTQANYRYDFTVKPEDLTNFDPVSAQYCRIEEVNGEMHIIVLADFINTDTANSHTFRFGRIDLENLPPEIATKIYGLNGPISQNNAGTIRIVPAGVETNATPQIVPVILTSSVAKTLTLIQPDNITVLPDDTITISFEVNLSLF